jgi:hypothetical protein
MLLTHQDGDVLKRRCELQSPPVGSGGSLGTQIKLVPGVRLAISSVSFCCKRR